MKHTLVQNQHPKVRKRGCFLKSDWTFTHGYDEVMTWHACCHTGQNNPFVNGCVNLRTSTLARHGSSKSHLTALKQLQPQSHFKKAVANVETEHEKCFVSDKRTKRHTLTG